MDYNLCDINMVNFILKKHDFRFSKSLGQNFIIDESVCPEMAYHLECDDKTGVLEIGPGIGVLTKEISGVAGKVVCLEADTKLLPILDETLSSCKNVEIINCDALKVDLEEIVKTHFEGCEDLMVCANLPYNITSPIIMKLLTENPGFSRMVLMVQKEAADRLCAQPGTRDCGAVSAAVQYYSEAEQLFEVGRDSYVPAPKVDSAVIKLEIREKLELDIPSEKAFFRLVRSGFSQRRKTLVNSLTNAGGYNKQVVVNALNELGIDVNIRAEKLTMEDFASLCRVLERK